MSEYKTLKEWFGEATRGAGRKFTRSGWLEDQWLEPIFLDSQKEWNCLNNEGRSVSWNSVLYTFKEWHPPKKTKKIIMYKPIFKHKTEEYFFTPFDLTSWCSSKDTHEGLRTTERYGNIVGWISQEVEVDDE